VRAAPYTDLLDCLTDRSAATLLTLSGYQPRPVDTSHGYERVATHTDAVGPDADLHRPAPTRLSWPALMEQGHCVFV
jgi:hypothetical protein